MLDKWVKKKEQRERDYDTHRIYDVSEFIFEDEIKEYINIFLKNYRDKLKPHLLKDCYTTDNGMLLAVLPLIEELKSYYNNDLCISVATSIGLERINRFNLRTYAYYAENALIRICSAWEYIFIILNQFLDTEMVVGTDIRNKILEAKCNKVNFVRNKNGYKMILTPLSDSMIQEIKPMLKKEYKLFKISTKNKSNSFYKVLKKKYSINDNLKMILQLYNSDDFKEISELRNEFIHRRPLGAKFSVSPIEIVPNQGVSINPRGWYEFENLDLKLEKNLSILRNAIQMLVNIVFSNDVPNLKVNENKSFFAYKVYCNNCSKESLINDATVEIFKKNNKLIICPYCKKDDTDVNEKIEVHDRYYFSNIKDYNEFIFNNFKRHEAKELED